MKNAGSVSSCHAWDQRCAVPNLPHLNAEMVVFFLDFSKEALLNCKEMSNGLQMRFSSDQHDFLRSQPDCALLSNEVGRMRRGLYPCIRLLTR